MWLVSAFRKCANNVCGVFMFVVVKVFTILKFSFVSTKFILGELILKARQSHVQRLYCMYLKAKCFEVVLVSLVVLN